MMKNEQYSHAAAVFIDTPWGVVLIQDPQKSGPWGTRKVFWKCPGGTRDDDETPEETVVRETYEETGLILNRADLVLVSATEEQGLFHFRFLFAVKHPSLAGLKSEGNEKEKVAIFRKSSLWRMYDFFIPHKEPLRDKGYI